jgi:hypothetical protein
VKLDARKVREIVLDSLFKDEEAPKDGSIPLNAIIVEGITVKIGFHKERLESHREEIRELLAELPENFMAEKGGGWSFLNACNDKDGHQWGEHRNMEELFMLGMGLGVVKYILPRKMWAFLPGAMPYVSVHLS